MDIPVVETRHSSGGHGTPFCGTLVQRNDLKEIRWLLARERVFLPVVVR